MKIGIIGSGNMGSGLGKLFAGKGHSVFFSSRNTDIAVEVAKAVGDAAQGGTVAEAVKFGEAILVATPWSSTPDAIKSAGTLEGKIIIDCTNPLEPDLSGLTLGFSTSAAEEIAKLAPGSRIVKAFNTVFAEIYHSRSRLFGSRTPTMFYCGDDTDAKTIVKKLIFEVGFEPIDAGPLTSARYLEPLAMLVIQLGYGQKMGTNFSISLMHR
jgi:predicted dinucleotide-binding enzyme